MNVLDWCVLGFLLASCLLGVLRGAAKEVVGLGGWLGGLVLAFFLSPLLAPLLVDWIAVANLRWLASFTIIFISVRLLAWGLGMLMAELIAAAKLSSLDKAIGLLFGAVRGLVVLFIAASLAMMTRLPQTPLWQVSTLVPWIEQGVTVVKPFLPHDVQQWFKK